jgi:Flp pilus assembly protein TadD
MGRYDKALSDYNAAIELAPTNAEIYFGRSEVLEKLGRCQDALYDISKAMELTQNNERYSKRKNRLIDTRCNER